MPAVCTAAQPVYAKQMGHTAVLAARHAGLYRQPRRAVAYGTEALRIVSEGIADFATIDRILK